MSSAFSHIAAERRGDVLCVRLLHHELDDHGIRDMSNEIEAMIDREDCRKLVFSLGPLRCIFSVFIARLIKIRRKLTDKGGGMRLCDVNRDVMNVLESCRLQDYFEFARDTAAAVATFGKSEAT